MSTSNNPSSASVSGLTERMNKLTQQISQQEAKINRGTRTMGAVGLIALLVLGGYFYVGYKEIAGMLEPKQLVLSATGVLDQNLPSAREALVEKINLSAPDWAANVSQEAQAAIPKLRNQIEDYVLTETDKLAGQVTNLTEDKFRKAMHDNHEVIEKGFKELADNDKLSEESLKVLVQALDQELKTDMLAQSKDILETVRFLSARVQRLSVGNGLDEEERCERRIAMLSRRLQLMEADPKPIKMPELKKKSEAAAKATDSDKPAATDDAKDAAKADKPDSKAADDAK